MSGGVTVRWGTERVRFEGTANGRWRRIREQWTGCAWRRRGAELVDELEIEADADVLEVIDS